MLLLPDQTYEQSREPDSLAPVKALKHLLNDTKYEPHITNLENDGKVLFNTSKSKLVNSPLNTSGDIRPTDKTGNHVNSPESFEKVSEFFNNIPEFVGEPLGPFSIKDDKDSTKTDAELLKECERFLNKYRIKPEFFCQYRKALE